MRYLNKTLLIAGLLMISLPSFSADYGVVKGSDNQIIELVRMNKLLPEYPRQAVRYGIEGSVKVQFNVDSFGAVLDPFVVESNPPGLFERASIKAVRKLIYQPPTFENEAVNVEGVQVDIVFKLQ
tara:strand:+ start:420 stop:794 length:375 start_codon:yes stop_codon:yes gene_type:complete